MSRIIKETSAEVSALAVYETQTGRLLGRLRMVLVKEGDHSISRHTTDEKESAGTDPLYIWEATPGTGLNPALFPERSLREVPPFLHDCVAKFDGPSNRALAFALRNHSSAQSAFTLIPCLPWDPPDQMLFDAALHSLEAGAFVPARVLEGFLDRLPSDWQGIAWERIMSSRFSEIEELISSELQPEEKRFPAAG